MVKLDFFKKFNIDLASGMEKAARRLQLWLELSRVGGTSKQTGIVQVYL